VPSIFQAATEIARRAGHDLAGSGHLLAAVTQAEGGLQEVLETHGLGQNRVRAALYRILPPYAEKLEESAYSLFA